MIIAVDFDGILTHNDAKFPKIGSPNWPVINFVKYLIAEGHEVVLWTSRVDRPLENAVRWCAEHGLQFAAVNENAPSNIKKYQKLYPNGTRKVYADVYIDDHSPEYVYYLSTEGEETATNVLLFTLRRIIYGNR